MVQILKYKNRNNFWLQKNMNKTDQVKIIQTQWSVTIGDYMTNKSNIL